MEQEHMTLVKSTPTSQEAGTHSRITNKEKEAKQQHTTVDIPEATNNEWDIRSAKIITVPADGLCMYHCVHAAGDPEWMRNRHTSGTSLDKQRERVDATRAQPLRQRFITYLAEKGLHEASQRLSIAGSRGYPTTDDMLHIAEMRKGKIELVDLEEPEPHPSGAQRLWM